jgi:hypothetical protein
MFEKYRFGRKFLLVPRFRVNQIGLISWLTQFRRKAHTDCHSPMTPTTENIKVFVALCLGIALLLSGCSSFLKSFRDGKSSGADLLFSLWLPMDYQLSTSLPSMQVKGRVGETKQQPQASWSHTTYQITTNISLSTRYPANGTTVGTKGQLTVTLARFTLGKRCWFVMTRCTPTKPTFAAFGEQ